MKKMNKLLALVLAMVMVLGLATVASAATVTIADNKLLSDHSFTAYQIFSGREEGGVLSDVVWGDGIDDEFLTALQENEAFAACTSAEDVAKVLAENNSNDAVISAFSKLALAHKTGDGVALEAPSTDLEDGYYLIVDSSTSVSAGGAYNASLLQVVGNIEIKLKTDAPSVEKKVWEDDKYNQDGNYGTGFNDVADHNMGEAVPFHLIGTVPNMSNYDIYKYIFHDTLSSGLTLDENSIKVYVSSDKKLDDADTEILASSTVDETTVVNWTKSVNGQSFTISFADLKTVSGVSQDMYIIVAYTAVLNQNAIVGLDGNPNTVYLEYSNKPDQSGEGDNNSTGTTPEDTVIVFTYELDTTKVDGQDNTKKLENAKFVLLNSDATKVAKITNGKFDGWEPVPEKGENGEISWPTTSILTSGEDGLFSVVGLDDGTYKLREIAAPAGYNLLAQDITVVITATTSNIQDWAPFTANTALTGLTVTADNEAGQTDLNAGSASITVVNNAGTTLPETGGIGTTIFYVLGGMLVVCAVVLMVSKKRMSAEG